MVPLEIAIKIAVPTGFAAARWGGKWVWRMFLETARGKAFEETVRRGAKIGKEKWHAHKQAVKQRLTPVPQVSCTPPICVPVKRIVAVRHSHAAMYDEEYPSDSQPKHPKRDSVLPNEQFPRQTKAPSRIIDFSD